MSRDIDIHQLDPKRQVLFILDENDAALSVPEIKEKLLAHGISPEVKAMNSFLSNTLRDKRGTFIKDGWVHKVDTRYRIMQKGREYLKSTVILIDPSREESTQETIRHLLSNLSGDIELCDPYFDDQAYELLRGSLDSKKIKTIRVIHSNNRLNTSQTYRIGKHSMQFKNIKNIHDRFLIDASHLYVLGTSLNHIGAKLSFIFHLSIYKNQFAAIFQEYWS